MFKYVSEFGQVGLSGLTLMVGMGRAQAKQRSIIRCRPLILWAAAMFFAASAPANADFVFSGSATGGTFDYDGDGVPDGTWSMSNSGQAEEITTFPTQGGVSFEYRNPAVFPPGWNLTSVFDAQPFDPEVTYALTLFGNNLSGRSFGSFFQNYQLSWTGGSGTAVVDDPDTELTSIVSGTGTVSFAQILSGSSGGSACNRPTGAINNNCIDWSVVLPQGATELTLNALNGAQDEGFRFGLVSYADISVTKSVSESTIAEGGTGSYTIEISNVGAPGESAAVGTVVLDPLPAGVSYASHSISSDGSNPGGAYDSATGEWRVGKVSLGETITLTVDFSVDAGTAGTSISNTIAPSDIQMTQIDPRENHGVLSAAFDAIGVPVAVADSSTGNAIGSAPEVDVVANDTADTGRTLDPTTVALIDPATGDPVTSLVVAGQGTWSVNGTTGAVTFTPLATFTGNPDPVSYTVADDQGNTSAPATVTVAYAGVPLAVADESLGNAIGTVPEVDVVGNDSADTGRTLDPTTVALIDPATGDPVTSLVVAGQGTWSVNGTTGVVTFTPLATFTGNPDPVSYTVADDQGNTSAPATVTVTYTGAPTAVADSSLDNEIGLPVSVSVLDNDSADTGRTLDPTSVRLIDPATGVPGTTLTVPGQGEWAVSPAGIVTFTPEDGFTGSPDPVSYTVDDNQGNTSAPATITVGYVPAVNIEVIEAILSDDLQQTTTMLSGNASRISRRAADRLNVSRGQTCGDEINDLLRSNPIYFATDKFYIDARNNAVLDRIALILNDCPGARFVIAGHTDARASDAYNLVLSQNRVNAVKAALISRGIANERLAAEGFGERRPVATNETAEGMALNRRVEFMLLDENAAIARPCGDADDPSGGLNGGSDGDTAQMNGTYRSTGYDCVTDTYHEAWAEVSVTHDDDRGTMGMLSFGMSRERQADNRLFGQFVEGYLSKSDVDTAEANGTITGVGIHAGLFGANATESGLILSYYGSAAIGHHSFELQTIETADGNYTYAGLFLGGAVGGEREYDDLILKPRIGVDLAYAATLGSEISVPDVELDIDPATYARAFAELGMEHVLDDGAKVQFAPRAFCAITGTDGSDDCGFGAMFSYETLADDTGTHWDITADYEQIGSRQTATLSVARNVNILDGLGVSKSRFSATQTGAIEAGQAFEFTW